MLAEYLYTECRYADFVMLVFLFPCLYYLSMNMVSIFIEALKYLNTLIADLPTNGSDINTYD
jgi:hypothetical protein